MLPLLIATTAFQGSAMADDSHAKMENCCKMMDQTHDCCDKDGEGTHSCQGNCDMVQCCTTTTSFIESRSSESISINLLLKQQQFLFDDFFVQRELSKGIFRPPIIC